jgi:F-type H+-transporting ATPase subunit alpha
LEAFTKFGSDLDAVTLNVIEKEKRNVEILKQGLNDPYSEDKLRLSMLVQNLLRNVPVNKVKEFEKDFLEFLNNKHRATLDALKAGKLTDEITDVIQTVAKEISAKYN